VILGYLDDVTRAIHVGEETKAARRFAVAVRKVARRKLDLIGAAAEIRDLAVPPGNRLEQLRGDLEGFYSIRVNDQYRIIFKFGAGNASNVRLIDYH
jgi:proteic killer suppression protein